MSETMKNFRSKKAVDAETVNVLLNNQEPETDQSGTTPEPELIATETDEFTRVRDDRQQVDKFFKFDTNGVEFIGRFSALWTADDDTPFDGLLFTEGRDKQSDNSTTVLIPTHSQLVRYFTDNNTPGVLYKIVRIEKVELKGGKTFVKFAIYQSNS